MGNENSKSASISKTIHVDFKAKQVIKVEEGEYVGKTVHPGLAPREFFGSNLGNDFGDMSGFASALQIDPARYMESVVQKFEQVCDEQGLYNQRAYKNPQVLHDAIETFAILQREIPMLIDTMENLRDMIQAQTGNDPSARIQVNKK